LFLKNKKIVKVIPSSITKIKLIIYIKDPKEAPSVNHIYIEEDTKVKETIIADIITTTYFVGSDAISVINLNAS
jgi:hypothetical protein